MLTPRDALRVLPVGAAAVVLLAAACHAPTIAGVNSPCPSTPVQAAGLDMQAADSTLVVGDSVEVFAFPVNARGVLELCTAEIEFASSDPGVAMVSSGGRVAGVSAGTAYIRASAGTARDSLPMRVVAAAVASVATR
jgi:Big-like domain-containing protein